ISDNYSFSFESKEPLNWKAGQHGLFNFKGEKLIKGNARMFSVASSPHEEMLTIGTKIGRHPSEFKAKLKAMEIGDSIFLRGPFGSFFVSSKNKNKNIALIGGGIGITPMRAILKDLEHRNTKKSVKLFYIDSNREYVFKDELDKISSNNPRIKIVYLTDRKDLKENIVEYVKGNKNRSCYFISGNPNMVKEMKVMLKENGIKRRNSINDSFRGYK
ncbi:MAG: FAD-dependent oxidoreductase, partial [Carnobacterium sp.]|nr:FAD-dependent oxidoreductase [Carnobacterium sp.]